MREECWEDEKDSPSDRHICDIEHREVSHTDKVCHRTKISSLQGVQEATSEDHEVAYFFYFWDIFPWFPEENTDTQKYQGNDKWNPR